MSPRVNKLMVSAALVAVLVFIGFWYLSESSKPANDSDNSKAHESADFSHTFKVDSNERKDSSVAENAEQLTLSDNLIANQDNLRRFLLELSKDDAVKVILHNLKTGQNSFYDRPFVTGVGGKLRWAPSSRVLLLDILGQLDPKIAESISREIIENTTFADEFAIALRNLVWAAESRNALQHERPYLVSAVGQMLNRDAWLEEPTPGLAEALDVAVHLNALEVLPELAAIIQPEQHEAMQYAGFMTMDRFMINEPARTTKLMLDNPQWFTGREETRASYLSRLDLGDPQQLAFAEQYLASQNITKQEKASFIRRLPNLHLIQSHNLVSDSFNWKHEQVLDRIKSTQEALENWQTRATLNTFNAEITETLSAVSSLLDE